MYNLRGKSTHLTCWLHGILIFNLLINKPPSPSSSQPGGISARRRRSFLHFKAFCDCLPKREATLATLSLCPALNRCDIVSIDFIRHYNCVGEVIVDDVFSDIKTPRAMQRHGLFVRPSPNSIWLSIERTNI